jgi:hypothetical protein
VGWAIAYHAEDRAGVAALQRKHEGLERDLAALAMKLETVFAEVRPYSAVVVVDVVGLWRRGCGPTHVALLRGRQGGW